MAVHVHTLVGGKITTLRPFVQHYTQLGVDSISVNVHMHSPQDSVLAEAIAILDEFGLAPASVVTGEWQDVIPGVYERSRLRYPSDWHITADHDEFQVYPMPLKEVVDLCQSEGCDYVVGCFVDRFAANGEMPEVDPYRSIWEQYPVRAFVTFPLAGGVPRKVVLSRTHVRLVKGQHFASGGNSCPLDTLFIPVHHFKWTGDVMSRLARRTELLERQRYSQAVESARIVDYAEKRAGRIDLTERRFLASRSSGDYPYWPQIRTWMKMCDTVSILETLIREGPIAVRSHHSLLQRMSRDIVESTEMRAVGTGG